MSIRRGIGPTLMDLWMRYYVTGKGQPTHLLLLILWMMSVQPYIRTAIPSLPHIFPLVSCKPSGRKEAVIFSLYLWYICGSILSCASFTIAKDEERVRRDLRKYVFEQQSKLSL